MTTLYDIVGSSVGMKAAETLLQELDTFCYAMEKEIVRILKEKEPEKYGNFQPEDLFKSWSEVEPKLDEKTKGTYRSLSQMYTYVKYIKKFYDALKFAKEEKDNEVVSTNMKANKDFLN